MLNIIDVGKRFGSMSVSSISYDNLTVKDKVYLLEQYGTMENLYEHIDEMNKSKRKEKNQKRKSN